MVNSCFTISVLLGIHCHFGYNKQEMGELSKLPDVGKIVEKQLFEVWISSVDFSLWRCGLKMIIRKMKIEDYDNVYNLWMSCTGMGLNNLDDSKEGIEKFIQRNPDTCLVAENNDSSIIGVIMVGNDGRRGYIYHTAVHPDCRKQGIAGKLVDSAMNELSALGINKVALVVFDRNDIGNGFWESKGFIVRDDLVYRNKALTEIVRIDT